MFELNDKKIIVIICSLQFFAQNVSLSGPLKIAYFLHLYAMISVNALRVQITFLVLKHF